MTMIKKSGFIKTVKLHKHLNQKRPHRENPLVGAWFFSQINYVKEVGVIPKAIKC